MAAAALAPPTSAWAEPAPVPSLTVDELRCQRATADGASNYLAVSFRARGDCFDAVTRGVLPPTTDCRAPVDVGTGHDDTDDRLSRAEGALIVDIQNKCLAVSLDRLAFPGVCKTPYDPPYDTFDHAQCLIEKANAVLDRLLDIENPPFPGPNLPLVDADCQEAVAGQAARMFFREIRVRTVDCEQRRLEGKISPSVDCRSDDSDTAPGTGDQAVDDALIFAHTRVTEAIAPLCELADIDRLGFPHKCPNAIPPFFLLSDLIECMYITHHSPLVRHVNTIVPLTNNLCGNCEIDADNDETCDDGDKEWTPGELCRENCVVVSRCGDPDDSGVITAQDALLALQAAVGLAECHPSICDVDGNGVVNGSDARHLLQASVGLPYPAECVPPSADELVCPAT